MPLPIYFAPHAYQWAQVLAPALPPATLSTAGEALLGIVALYLAKVVVRLDKTVGSVVKQLDGGPRGEGGLTTAIERIENGYQRLNDAVTKQGVELQMYAADAKMALEKVSACPYHGPDRRHDARVP